MGYYIQTPGTNFDKAAAIVAAHGGTKLSAPPRSFETVPEDKALVVVVHNGAFEAAGVCVDEREFDAFTYAGERRFRDYLLLDKQKAYELAGYKGA